jgi:hypothetical protein
MRMWFGGCEPTTSVFLRVATSKTILSLGLVHFNRIFRILIPFEKSHYA